MKLSPRQTECLKWLYYGYSNERISKLMGIKRSVVKRHLRLCYMKLGIKEGNNYDKRRRAIEMVREASQ